MQYVLVQLAHRIDNLTELAQCIDFFHKSLWWFDSTEPSLSTAVQRNHLVPIARCVRSANYILTETVRYKDFYHSSSGCFDRTESSGESRCVGCKMHRFDVIQAQRTLSHCSLTDEAFLHTGSGWPNLL